MPRLGDSSSPTMKRSPATSTMTAPVGRLGKSGGEIGANRGGEPDRSGQGDHTGKIVDCEDRAAAGGMITIAMIRTSPTALSPMARTTSNRPVIARSSRRVDQPSARAKSGSKQASPGLEQCSRRDQRKQRDASDGPRLRRRHRGHSTEEGTSQGRPARPLPWPAPRSTAPAQGQRTRSTQCRWPCLPTAASPPGSSAPPACPGSRKAPPRPSASALPSPQTT